MVPTQTRPKHTFSVLIVDDEDAIRVALGRILAADGYEVHAASRGADALVLLDKMPIDLLLTDYNMPGMNGVDLAEKVLQVHPDVIRIILTVADDFAVVKEAINRAQIYRFLSKPWDASDLRLTVRSACEQRRLERENAAQQRVISRQQALLDSLENQHPGITSIKRDAGGAILLDDPDET